MQKSMVHQLNPLIASNVQFSRAAFIHTVYENDFNELRKSRIQNLPNYRKQDLSGKINFVVVFQAIEIQRLSVQVETLRVKLKDYERQFSNYENYEVQIRQLTEKCHIYQLQRQDHQEAMQKMHKICQQLYNELQEMRARYADIDLSLKQKYRLQRQRCQSLSSEVERWKARYNASETSKVKELQDMRMMLQNQRKSMLQRQLRELSVKYQSQRKMLENQLRKLRQTLQNRNSEIQRIRMELEQTKIRQSQFKQYEIRLDEYEDKLMMMAQQNMRLNQLLRMKKQEIQNLKNNQRNLQNRLISFKKIQDQFNQANRRIQNYQIQIREWTQKYSRLQAENNKNQILSNKAQQYQKLLDKSADEMQRMNSIIRQKISQIQKWKTQSQRLSLQLQQSKIAENQISEYQNQIATIVTENSRLNDILKSRLEQIQNWKLKYSEIETKIPLLNQSQNQNKNLQQKLSIQISIRTQLNEKIKVMQNDLAKAAEIQHNFQKQKMINQDLHKQIDRLNNSIRNISSQNNDYVRKLQTIQLQLRQNSGLLDQLAQCKRKITQMTQQLDRINGVLHQKIQQLKQLKDNYNSISINTARYRNIEQQFVTNLQQTEQLVLKLDESRRQNEFIQQKVMQLQGNYKKLQGELFINNEQKQKLVSIMNQKKKQIQDCLMRLDQADQKISQLLQVELQYKNLKNSYGTLQQKTKEWQTRFTNQTKRSQEFSLQVERLTAEINKLRTESNFSKQFITEFVLLKTQSEQKDKQIIGLLQRIAKIEQIIMKLKQESKKNYNNMCVYKEKWVHMNSNFESIMAFFNKLLELQDKVDKLAEENIQLQSNVRIMNATMQMNVEMAESSYATQNWKKNIIEPRKSQIITTPIHQKSEISSRSQKLLQVQQLKPKLSMTPTQASQTSNYYQSQVRQVSSGYIPVYSNVQGYQFNSGPVDKNVSYTVKTLKPGSNEVTTTYTYNNTHTTGSNQPYFQPQNNIYRGSQIVNGAQYVVSNQTPGSSQYIVNNSQINQRPSSNFVSSYKYSSSDVRRLSEVNDGRGNISQINSPIRQYP